MKRNKLKRIKNRSEVHTPKETDLYFYHPDHLGSAAWVTDSGGHAIQHLQYLPFGETRLDQRTTSWNTRYSFVGREKDEESGYSYMSSRYYNSDISLFLSVDPMAHKYPSLTPYSYSYNNPIILKDPNGRDWDPEVDEANQTITIHATYYTSDKDKDRAQAGADAWNAQSGKYSYTTGEGENKKTYTVNFDLKVESYADADKASDAYTSNRGDGKSNFFQTVPEVKAGGIDVRGVAQDGSQITVRTDAPDRTSSHEMGHTLGLGEGINLMKSGGTGNRIIKSHIRTILDASGLQTLGTSRGPDSRAEEATPKRTYNMIGVFDKKR